MDPVVSPLGYRYSGQPGAVQQPFPGVRFTPRTGRIELRRWEGTPDEIAAVESALQRDGISYRIPGGQHGGYQVIEIDEPTPERNDLLLYETDELIGFDPEKSMLQSPALVAAGARPVDIAALAYIFGQFNSDQLTYEQCLDRAARQELSARLESGTSLPVDGTFQNVFKLHVQGVRGFQTSTHVIRRTSIFAPSAPVQTVINVNKVYENSADLETAEVIDPFRIWEIPAGQWLKKTPSFIRQRNGTTIFTVEWLWALEFSASLYARATLPS